MMDHHQHPPLLPCPHLIHHHPQHRPFFYTQALLPLLIPSFHRPPSIPSLQSPYIHHHHHSPRFPLLVPLLPASPPPLLSTSPPISHPQPVVLPHHPFPHPLPLPTRHRLVHLHQYRLIEMVSLLPTLLKKPSL